MSDPVLDAAPDAVMTIDEHGVLVEFNAAAERLLGYARADAIGRAVADLVIPRPFRAAHLAGLRRAVEGGPTHILGSSAEMCAQHADGREILVWMSLTRTSVDPPRFTAWMRDLSEHQGGRAEADRMARVAQEPAAIGSWEWIPAEGTIRWSDNVFRMLGAEPGEVEPSFEYFLARVHPDDRERLVREARDMRGNAQATDRRMRIVRPDGQVRHLSSSVAVTEWRDGEPHRMLGRFEDLTERLRSQRGIAAHIAVETALSGWDGFERGGERLLGGLADALGYEAGVLWVRNGDMLAARVLWQGAGGGPSPARGGRARPPAAARAAVAPGTRGACARRSTAATPRRTSAAGSRSPRSPARRSWPSWSSQHARRASSASRCGAR